MRILYVILLTTLFVSCSSVPKEYLTNNDICHYNDPIFKITKQEMTFDVEKYGKELENGSLVLIDNDKFKNRYYRWENNGDITNKQTNKQTNIQKLIKYDVNGKIFFSYFKYLNGSSEIGKESEYDQQGNITKIIDHEKGYKICWAEAIEIVKKLAEKDIKKYEIDKFYLKRVDLNEFPKEAPAWRVAMEGNEEYNNKDTKFYVICGITGKLKRTYNVRQVYDD